VLNSTDYVAKLNNPTPWSECIRPLLKNFRRGGGLIRVRAGTGQAGSVAPIVFVEAPPANAADLVSKLSQNDAIAAASLLEVDQAKAAVQTREKSMRTTDQSFAALLLVEGVRDRDVSLAVEKISASIQDRFDGVLYRQIFALHRDTLAGH
jgi:hypothetical protein